MRRTQFLRKTLCLLAMAGMLGTSSLPAFADDKNKTPARTTAKLDDKEDPQKIGKRNINKGSIQFYSIEKEMGIGQQLAADLDRQLKFVSDPIITEYVNRVGQNIVLNSDAKVPFTIKVVDSEEVNAFALPGGFFYVNKGLILAADNEGELASVMAHEIAHVTARHSTEQVSKGQLLQLGSIPLIFLGGIGGVLAANGANILVPLTFLKFSRNAENEADMLGAQYAWASGYDPNSMVTFFEKLQAREKNKPGTMAKLFSTHPTNGDRITRVRELINRFPQRDEYVINTSEFSRVKARLGYISGATNKRVGNDPNNPDNGPRRPTLKRHPNDPNSPTVDPSSDSNDSGGQPSSAPADRPTLKRRPQETPPPTSDNPPPQVP
ncbi:MAG: M48 family metalloprotease [Blastocatellia bacterium]|nr:M48 family metalloprotease [Blastocatellia bacterium]